MNLQASFSRNRDSWCVFKKEGDVTMRFLWRCNNQSDAEELAKAVNNGATTCRGCRELGTNCGTCVKCRLTTHNGRGER